MRLVLVLLFLLLLLPCAAYANMFVPILTQMIACPLDWPGLFIAIPLILIINILETLVINKHNLKGSFKDTFFGVLKINLITFLLSGFVSDEKHIWLSLAFSFILTIIVEALLVERMLQQQFEIGDFGSALTLSIKMNTASYALMTLIMLGLIYIPALGADQPEVLAKAHGQLLVNPSFEARVIDLNTRQLINDEGDTFNTPLMHLQCFAVGNNRSLFCVTPAESPVGAVDIWLAWISGKQWDFKLLGEVKSVTQTKAISRDGRLLLCRMAGNWVIYDWKNHTKKKLPRQWEDIWNASFSGDNKYLIVDEYVFNLSTGKARQLEDIPPWFSVSPYEHKLMWQSGDHNINIYDYEHNKRRSLSVKGEVRSKIALSPDGRLIAYTCEKGSHYHYRGPEIRITDIRTGASAAVYGDPHTLGSSDTVIWIK